MEADTISQSVAVIPALIVFGRDESGKPHASWFAAPDAKLAERAAGVMGMQALRVATDEHRAAAQGLAQGRVFASGRAFTPFCKAAAYDALAAFGEAFAPPAPVEPEPAQVPAITLVPTSRDEIDVGSLVLASEGCGVWYDAIVTAGQGADIFALCWRDYPDEPQIIRRAEHLGLAPACAADADWTV